MNPNPFAQFAAGNTDTSFDSPKKRKCSDEPSEVIDLCESENEELKIPQSSNHRTFIPIPSPRSNPSDLFIFDQGGADSEVPPEKEVIDLTVDVQGHPKDDSAYLASDDSNAPRRTMRILKPSSWSDEELSDGDDEESFDQPTAPFPFHLMCNKVGDKYKYSDEKASKCLVNNPNFSDLQVVAAEKFLALVAKGKADWEKYRDLFTDNGRYTTLSGMKRNIVIDRETKRFDLHHICQVSLGGSDRLWVNVIPLLCDSDHTEIHVQASVFISDREVQNAAKMMLDLSAMKPSDFLNEGSDEIRMANFTEANKGRFKALSERMKGNSIGAGPHVYPSERKSRGPGSFGGSIFAFGNRHSVVHEDAAILADFGKYKCAGNQWWIKCLGANDGDVVKLDNGRTLVKSSGNKMMATRHVVGKCRSNAKHCAKKAAKKAAKEAAVLVEDDTVRDAARKQWSSFCK